MSRFEARLRGVAEALDVPSGVRVEILEELSADLDALYAELVAAGASPREARRRAERMLAPAPWATDALAGVHRPWPLRVVAGVPAGMRGRLNRGLLATATSLVLTVSILEFARAGLLRAPSPFLWAQLALAAVLVAVALRGAARLWLDGGDPRTLRRGLGALLGAPAGAVLLAVLGTVVGLGSVAGRIAHDPSLDRIVVVEWLMRSVGLWWCATLMLLLGGLAWLLLAGRAAGLERRETTLFLGPRRLRRDPLT